VKVLYFADTRFPIERANGLQSMATCQALAAAGHDVTLVTRPDSAPLPRDPFAFYGLPRAEALRFETIPTSKRVWMRRLTFLWGAVRLARRNRDAVVLTRDLGLASRLLSLPSSGRPRVVYESHGIAPIVAAEMNSLLGQAGSGPSASKLARLDRQERRVWQRAHAYVTITSALADDLAARYGPRDEVFVVPDGASVGSRLSALGSRGNAEAAVAGYAGHLYPWKGVDVFVRALAEAPGIRGLIVGGHPGERDLSRVQGLVKHLGLSDRVEITGLVRPAEVAGRLARATMLVLPNTATAISMRYTSPLKLFEYLAMGRPIIASDLPAIREIVADGDSAILVPPGDASALAAAMRRVAGDPALAVRLADRALALAPAYSWDERAERLEAALETAAS
jgi:glycosyltransferase involved in cell wall biosynthesis